MNTKQQKPQRGGIPGQLVPSSPGISARWAFSILLFGDPGLRPPRRTAPSAVESRPVRGFYPVAELRTAI